MPSPPLSLPLRTVEGVAALHSEALLREPSRERDAVYAWLTRQCRARRPSIVIGLESWGYLFAAPVALRVNAGLGVARRRVDRLGSDAVVETYDMNRARGHAIGMERSSLEAGARALLVDDTVISGGTLKAAADIVRNLGGEVVAAVAIVGHAETRPAVSERLGAPLHCFRWV